MNSLNFLDTNVWLALVWERHSHAELARDWFSRCDDEQLLFCRFTQLALLRLLTTKAVMGKDVKSMAGAWEVYDRCYRMSASRFFRSLMGWTQRCALCTRGISPLRTNGRTPIWLRSLPVPG